MAPTFGKINLVKVIRDNSAEASGKRLPLRDCNNIAMAIMRTFGGMIVPTHDREAAAFERGRQAGIAEAMQKVQQGFVEGIKEAR